MRGRGRPRSRSGTKAALRIASLYPDDLRVGLDAWRPRPWGPYPWDRREKVTFPISRQGLEQIAIALAVGAAVFGLFALIRWRRGGEWQRFAQSAGFLGALIVVSLGL